MKEKTVRVALSVPDSVRDTYQETADLMGIPMSRFIANLLVESAPSVKALQKPLKTAKQSINEKYSVLLAMQEMANEHQVDIEELIKNSKSLT
jgi:hypothetical protein